MTEHGPNLYDEIERLQRANRKHPPATPAKRAAKKLAAAVIKTRRPVEKPLFPGTSRNPERRPVVPRVPGTQDQPIKPHPLRPEFEFHKRLLERRKI